SAKKRFLEITSFLTLYLIGAFFVYQYNSLTIRLSGILLMGLALNSLGILIHDGLHGLLAKNKICNHILSFLCGLPLLISSTAYRTTHTDHHFELGRKLDYGTYKQHLGNRYLVWSAYFAQLLMGSVIYIIFIPILAIKSAATKTRIVILAEYLIIVAVLFVCLTYVPMKLILYYWLYPSLILMVLSNIRGLASHALGDLDDIYLSSRTVEASPVTAFLFLNENYHLEHHLFPQIPSYNLKKVHVLIWHRLPRALYSKSYLEFFNSFFKSALTLSLTPCGFVQAADKQVDYSDDNSKAPYQEKESKIIESYEL
ncbi:MAG: fatty acid desaturase, partial [Lentisphaeria bacterium]|nr:fatty acid desaturase [Lentisphaeria bacterium]NQZ69429.1 fatty acid desaturase [Lentisphaeria bacterium]